MDPHVLLFLAIPGAFWVASAFLHPNRRCGVCRGTGKHYGAVFTATSRPCHSCGGLGRKRRPLAVVLGIGGEPGHIIARRVDGGRPVGRLDREWPSGG